MASLQKWFDRVSETSTTTGTGTLTLAGARTGYRAFSTVGNAKSCVICIEAVDGDGVPTGEWEVCESVYTSSGTTLSRGRLLASSTGSRVSFSAGTKFVHLVHAAAKIPPTTVFASSVCVTDATSGSSGTDVTSELQAVLDQASSSAPLHLIIDGNCRVSGLDIGSFTTFEVMPNCTIYLADDSDRALLRNKNRKRQSDGSIADTNIVIKGGIWDGNRDEQTGVGSNSNQEPDGAAGAAGTFLVVIQMFGVAALTIEDLLVQHAKSIAIHCGYIQRGRFNRLWFDNNDGDLQQGGLQFDGACANIQVTDVGGTCWDDIVAVNTDEQSVFGGSADLGPYVGGGDITDINVNGINAIDSLSAFRVLGGDSRIDRVTFSNIKGTVRLWVGVISPLGTGDGNIGILTFDGIDVSFGADSGTGEAHAGFAIDGYVEQLRIKRFAVGPLAFPRALIHFRSDAGGYVGADVQRCMIEDFTIYDDDSDGDGMLPIKIEGHVGKLMIRNAGWLRDSGLTVADSFLKFFTGASVDHLLVNGLSANRVTTLIDQDAGSLTALQTCHITHNDSDGGYLFRAGSGVVQRHTASNWYGPGLDNVDGGSIVATFGDAYTTDPVVENLILEDTFTDTNGVSLDVHTMDIGLGWTEHYDQWTFVSNRVVAANSQASKGQVCAADAGLADAAVKATVYVPNTSFFAGGVAGRVLDEDNCWVFRVQRDGGTSYVQLIERNSGSDTQRDMVSLSGLQGQTLELEMRCNGNSIDCFVDGVLRCSYASATFQNTETAFGLENYYSTGSSYDQFQFDDFQVTAL